MAKRTSKSHVIRIKRVQESPTRDDGIRVLVDRLWLCGISKAKAKLDVWLKEIAPSSELRKWFGHDPARWNSFQRRYHRELVDQPEQMKVLRELIGKGPVTLLFAAKDVEHNNAVVLRDYLARHRS